VASGVNEDLLRDLVGYEYNIININAGGVGANRILMEYIYIYRGSKIHPDSMQPLLRN
jgi:hypothetical protein